MDILRPSSHSRVLAATIAMVTIVTGCSSVSSPSAVDSYWNQLQALCGNAYEGRMVEGTAPSDAEIGAERLVMHVRECESDQIRIPFHVGENRSRTWVLTRIGDRIRLEHDHRHEDGSPDEVTMYGGDSRPLTDPRSAEFPANAHTARIVPAAATNVWTMRVEPGRTFTYALERANRRFRVDFDLTRPVPPPPPPW